MAIPLFLNQLIIFSKHFLSRFVLVKTLFDNHQISVQIDNFHLFFSQLKTEEVFKLCAVSEFAIL
jgi:hypothetical protein